MGSRVFGEGFGGVDGLVGTHGLVGWKMEGWMRLLISIDDTTSALVRYQDCNTLVTRIEIRVMRD